MSARRKSRRLLTVASQRGQAAIIALLLIIGAGVTILIYNFPTPARLSIERNKKTAEALAQAKAALIGYAVAVDLSGAGRPGDLPCPDRDNDGDADAVPICNGAALGRLPWKTLGLPDLRDGDGERLWYAVSSNFKNNPRTPCAVPGDAGCLNSDSRGTITVRDRNGTVVNNGNDATGSLNPSGIIAVIIAPGPALQRQGAGTVQNRSCTVGVDCDTTEKCTASPTTLTPKCNPVNYLDTLSGTEDNADFVDSSSTNGFINGSHDSTVVNDQIITITHADLMPLLEKRVAKEVLNCLTAFAAVPQNRGRYPWAAPITDVATPYTAAADTRFGRLPDEFNASFLGLPIASIVCPVTPLLCMTASWPSPCAMTAGWWNNWKEMVFYGVAKDYQPEDLGSPILPPPTGGPCGDCLRVDPPSGSYDKRVVVAVAGKRLSGQSRSSGDKDEPDNYLEGDNVNSPDSDSYTQQKTTSSFNDILVFQ